MPVSDCPHISSEHDPDSAGMRRCDWLRQRGRLRGLVGKRRGLRGHDGVHFKLDRGASRLNLLTPPPPPSLTHTPRATHTHKHTHTHTHTHTHEQTCTADEVFAVSDDRSLYFNSNILAEVRDIIQHRKTVPGIPHLYLNARF